MGGIVGEVGMNRKIINEMIWTHTYWKTCFQNFIENGEGDFTFQKVEYNHDCDFGKWLEINSEKTTLEYSNITELHNKFHQEATKILFLFFSGQRNEARRKIEIGERFNFLSTQIVNTLRNIG